MDESGIPTHSMSESIAAPECDEIESALASTRKKRHCKPCILEPERGDQPGRQPYSKTNNSVNAARLYQVFPSRIQNET